MKIAEIETFSVRVPLHPVSWHSANIEGWSGSWWELPIVLLRMTTECGLTGLGEAPKGVEGENGSPVGIVVYGVGPV